MYFSANKNWINFYNQGSYFLSFYSSLSGFGSSGITSLIVQYFISLFSFRWMSFVKEWILVLCSAWVLTPEYHRLDHHQQRGACFLEGHTVTHYSKSLKIGSPKFHGILRQLCDGANYPIPISNSNTKYCLRNAPIIKIEPINRCADYPAFTVSGNSVL